MDFVYLWLIPAAVAAAGTLVGRYEERRELPWLNRRMRQLWALLTVAVVITAVVGRADGVGAGQFAFGLLIGIVGLAILPAFVFYVLGRLVRSPVTTGVLWLIGVFALHWYALVVGLLFAFGVACEPGCLS